MLFTEYLLLEAVIPKIWFHGSPTKFEKFDSKFAITKTSYAQMGPGFYLTNSKEDAESYGRKSKDGYIKEVTISSVKNIKTESSKIIPGLLEKLSEKIPDEEGVLSNWDENPIRARRELLKSIRESSKNIFELVLNVWKEYFYGYEEDFLKILIKNNIDGFLIKKRDGVEHLVVYNPDILKIEKVEQIKD
jgi:hypothetical protein